MEEPLRYPPGRSARGSCRYEQLTGNCCGVEAGEPRFFTFIILEEVPACRNGLQGAERIQRYLAVAPNGDLYPCHDCRQEHYYGQCFGGRVRLDLVTFHGAYPTIRRVALAAGPRFYWRGCRANAEATNGSIYRPHEQAASLARKRLECSLYLKSEGEPAGLKVYFPAEVVHLPNK